MRSAEGISILLPTGSFKSSLNARRRLAFSLCIGLLTSVILQALPAQRPLRVDVDLVNVVLTAQDGAGRFVTGLNEGDFRIYEDGVEQKIAVFEKEDVESAIGILLDNSLSMVDILPRMKTGLLDFAEHTSSFSELFVLTFGTRVRTLHDVGQPISQLESRLKALTVQGTSVLYDALVEGLRKVSEREPERKALLVFTDGIDTASKSGFKDVLIEAQKAGALLYFIPIGSRILIDEHTIDSLAKETGGRVIYLQKSDRVPPAMETIRQELAKQYYIGYYTARKPGFHSIRVEAPGRDVKIRAKSGYYSS
ncbi:MAG TPA: VWA domain-containing protein [Terriglobia bacterium]|nr:VWA domain-containing protein [Terriglobia bacterium]